MTISFDELPFDILFFITSYLSFDDIVSLGHSCRQLRALLHESTLCRRTIETHMRYTQEARQTQNHCRNFVSTQISQGKNTHQFQERQMSYIEAMRSIHEKRYAFSNCLPFSARVVGHAHGFCYRQGTLCILEGTTIRVVDVSNPSRNVEIDLSTTINVFREASTSTHDYNLTLLYFNEDVAAIHYERKMRPSQSCIFAINTKKDPGHEKRILGEITLASSYKLFVRHTAEWLYYGTYSAMGSNGHHEWEIRGVSLKNGQKSRLVLEGFFGTDLSSTVAFEVRDGFFYAVSNQTSFEVEEIDWTSFYHCIRFPLNYRERGDMEINRKVYRRQHMEGPIHDSWTELTIQFDDATGDAKIVESRREWIGSSSRQLRTFYTVDFDCKPTSTSDSGEDGDSVRQVPENDIFTSVLDHRNKPNWAPEQQRLSPTFHSELTPECGTARTFILARTKLKAYNLSSNSFLDLVEDDRCCNNPIAGPCLRIRVGSRRLAPLDWRAPGHGYIPSQSPGNYLGPKGDVVYRHSSIKMWPPPASTCKCSQRLHSILNPPLPNTSVSSSSYNRYIVGSVDEYGLVYMLRPGRPSGPSDENALGVVVMVSFTRDSSLASPRSMVDGSVTAGSGHHHERRAEKDEHDPFYWQWQPRVCKNGVCC
ncbi:hypothetical protein DM02DRAFT_610875 [Periconia macrospinosa]|uniref:F-box domain-containing protein n=1 Tax=Periconia macrospinosa TaxID=97972 RepID=A0A2V1E4K7_9PLEO|nr:hypothetical protein DM02DRAFT_610875 [Periconia macrospinosa]